MAFPPSFQCQRSFTPGVRVLQFATPRHPALRFCKALPPEKQKIKIKIKEKAEDGEKGIMRKRFKSYSPVFLLSKELVSYSYAGGLTFGIRVRVSMRYGRRTEKFQH